MSTVLEAIAAREAGLEVLGISLVTNLAAGMSGQPLDHAEVLAAGKAAAERMLEAADAAFEQDSGIWVSPKEIKKLKNYLRKGLTPKQPSGRPQKNFVLTVAGSSNLSQKRN